MKKILLVALAAITLASCAKNEVVELNEGHAISFRAWTSNAGRVTPTKTATIRDFSVWAYVGEKAYFDGIKVSRPDEVTPWDYTPHKFWPAAEVLLNFFSVSPSHLVNPNITVTAAHDGVTVDNFDATKQIDLLYGVNLGVHRETPVKPVQVEFDHALSQISFQAKNVNVGGAESSLKVVISGVKVANVNGLGTFTLPIGTATDGDNQAATAAQGDWVSSTPKTFTAGMAAATANITTATTVLTNEAGRLLLIPQNNVSATPWSKTNLSGSHFLVECTVQDVNTELYLWGASGTPKEVAIPFQANWEPGKHYIYTFQFGEGAGYDPTTGEQVLFPIDFTVLVDDFKEAPETPTPDAPVL